MWILLLYSAGLEMKEISHKENEVSEIRKQIPQLSNHGYKQLLKLSRCSPVLAGSPYPYYYKYKSRELWVARPHYTLLPQKGSPLKKSPKRPPVIPQKYEEYDANSRDPLTYVKFSPVLGGSPYKSDRGKMTRSLCKLIPATSDSDSETYALIEGNVFNIVVFSFNKN